ncbi:MAG: hypothetical protein KKG78_18755, partial [Alphaproteobacteria bacterium]|nr:hypothetical protein [Alphaproteobacteria bacterium]
MPQFHGNRLWTMGRAGESFANGLARQCMGEGCGLLLKPGFRAYSQLQAPRGLVTGQFGAVKDSQPAEWLELPPATTKTKAIVR